MSEPQTSEMLPTCRDASVLAHTSSTGRYVTSEAAVLALVRRGWLYDHGAQSLAGGMHYLTMTPTGRAVLEKWRSAQPKPPRPKRRARSEQFEAWMTYCEVWSRITFAEFREKVWPFRRDYR